MSSGDNGVRGDKDVETEVSRDSNPPGRLEDQGQDSVVLVRRDGREGRPPRSGWEDWWGVICFSDLALETRMTPCPGRVSVGGVGGQPWVWVEAGFQGPVCKVDLGGVQGWSEDSVQMRKIRHHEHHWDLSGETGTTVLAAETRPDPTVALLVWCPLVLVGNNKNKKGKKNKQVSSLFCFPLLCAVLASAAAGPEAAWHCFCGSYEKAGSQLDSRCRRRKRDLPVCRSPQTDVYVDARVMLFVARGFLQW